MCCTGSNSVSRSSWTGVEAVVIAVAAAVRDLSWSPTTLDYTTCLALEEEKQGVRKDWHSLGRHCLCPTVICRECCIHLYYNRSVREKRDGGH